MEEATQWPAERSIFRCRQDEGSNNRKRFHSNLWTPNPSICKSKSNNKRGEEQPGDLEADAAGGAGDDDGDAVERGQLERVGEVAGGDTLE